MDILIGVLTLLDKYKNTCSTLSCNFMNNNKLCKFYKDIGIITDTKCEFLNFEIIWINRKLFLSEDFIDNIKNCIDKKSRFIIIPLGIELRKGSHANYVIYDSKLNEFERFEPHGFGTPYKFNYDPYRLDEVLKYKLEPLIEGSKYIPPKDFLPKIGLQIFDTREMNCRKIGDPKGFCALWALWYTDMRIKYPDIDRKDLVNELVRIIKEQNISFRNLIRNYSKDITKTRDEILSDAGININDWLNDNYTKDQLDKIIKKITELSLKFS